MIMKSMYVKPTATVEEFVANEFVSLCVNLGCLIGERGGARGEKDTVTGGTHRKETSGSGCGWAQNQIFSTNASGVATIREVNANASQGGASSYTITLKQPTMLTDDNYLNYTSDGGNKVIWETSGSYKNIFGQNVPWTCTHEGYLQLQDPKHPGRS